MKKFYYCFIISAIWIIAAIANYYDGGNSFLVIYNLSAAALFITLGIAQFFLDKKGEKGKKLLKWIYIFTFVGIMVFLLFFIVVSLQ